LGESPWPAAPYVVEVFWKPASSAGYVPMRRLILVANFSKLGAVAFFDAGLALPGGDDVRQCLLCFLAMALLNRQTHCFNQQTDDALFNLSVH